ncbi:3-dehydroquinate synthase [Thiotrichales bacterium 19S11-10]|nr:3-dehydroquinate synthase [Thiotrichales bacterium 19S11-10]
MIDLTVKTSQKTYPIIIDDVLSNLNAHKTLFAQYMSEPVAIITNKTVASFYLSQWQEKLAFLGFNNIHLIILEDGEAYKNSTTLDMIYTELLKHQFSRYSLLFALGGGVIGDIVGFAAATYQRGIAFVQIPTTLLAQVDSSVGGKTAINHSLGKNMIGAFYQPLAVFTELQTLDTLKEREYAAGMAEVIKYGLIKDKTFYQWLLDHQDDLLKKDKSALRYAIQKSCEIKAQVVEADEKETAFERAKLNFGHTFGHAIEHALGYGQWLHGEAVSCGMVIALRLSIELGYIENYELERLVNLLSAFNLPVRLPDSIDKKILFKAMLRDKKNQNQSIRFVLLEKIGQAILKSDIDKNLVDQAMI